MGLRHKECRSCPLAAGSKKNYVPPEGHVGTCKYILVGESPGRTEVNKGRPFVGISGRLLDKVLGRAGIDRKECYLTNTVKCHPPDNQTSPEMIDACRPVLMRELEGAAENSRVALLGGAAKSAVLPHLSKGVLYNRGWHGSSTLVTVHPAYAVYNPNNIKICLLDMARLKRGPQAPVKPKVVLIVDVAQIPQAVKWLKANLERGQYVSLDLETEQVNPWEDKVLLVQFGVAPDRVIEVSGPVAYTKQGKDFIEGFFRQDIRIVGHNLVFDLKFLHVQLGICTGPEWNDKLDDTIVMHYALKETRPHGLKTLADEYFDTGQYDRELEQYMRSSEDNYSKVPKGVLAKYGAVDAEVTRRFAYHFEGELREQGLYDKPYRWPLMYAFPTLLHMSEHGLLVDREGLEGIVGEHIEPELEEIYGKMKVIAGKEFNPLSHVQVNNILYDDIGMPVVKARTRSKGRKIERKSSAKEVVDKWAAMLERNEGSLPKEGVAFAQLLKYYRHVQKMKGSYVEGWTKYIQRDGRVHPNYLLRGTVTGRISARYPAVQTIPSDPRDKWGMLVARNIKAPEGWKFLYADYSQAELRVAACISGDSFMTEVYNSEAGTDYHSQVAESAFGPDFNITQRQLVKRFTFGWLYGGDAYGIAKDALMFDEYTARHFSQWWDEKFTGIVQWRKEQAKAMLEQGYVEAPLSKRRRRFKLIMDKNRIDAEHAAMNMPIQSTASDLNLLSCCLLDRRYYPTGWAYVVLNVHDATIMEVRDDHAEAVAKDMQETMVGVAAKYLPNVPFEAEVVIGTDLADLMRKAEAEKFDDEQN